MKKSTVYVIANWKMAPSSIGEAKKLFLNLKKSIGRLARVKAVICPPVAFLGELRDLYAGAKLNFGVQDIHFEEQGSFTGKISAQMAKSIGASYCIIGHSELRAYGETDEEINKKVHIALSQKLMVVLCIGEHERDQEGEYLTFLTKELEAALKNVPQSALKNILIAYEPIWAIGKTGDDAMKPVAVYETVLFLRKIVTNIYDKKSALLVPILYGGSVEISNSERLLNEGGIRGFLVGHASLSSVDFDTILHTAETSSI